MKPNQPITLSSDRLKLRRLLVGMGIIMWCVLVAALIVLSLHSRQRIQISTEISTTNLARSLEGSVSNSLTGVGVALAGIEESLLAIRREGKGWTDVNAISRTLRNRVALTPLSRGLTLLDETGKTVVATHLPNPFAIHDLSDRDYFIFHRDNVNSKLRLSRPVQSKSDRRWVALASFRVQDAEGNFLGVLTASIDLSDLAKRLDGFYVPSHGSLVIIDLQGNVLARRPNHEANVGTKIPINYIPSDNSGHNKIISPLDGRLRYFGYEKSEAYNFIAVASVDVNELNAPWHQQLTIHVLIGVGGTLFIFLLLFYLVHQLNSHEALLSQLDSARNQAEESSRAKSNFLAGVSHELRTPLNAILGFSEIISKQYFGNQAQAKYAEYAQDIYGSSKHMLSLIDDLIDVTSIASGHFELHLKPFFLPAVTEECIALMRERIRESGVSVYSSIPQEFPKLFCDEKAIRQILLNLISNAIKFTPIDGRIEVAATINFEGEVKISVSDSGPGIPVAERDRLIIPFTRSRDKNLSQIEGTGLGLSICKKLAEAHGGRLFIDDSDFGGAKLVIILPPSRISLSEAAKDSAK